MRNELSALERQWRSLVNELEDSANVWDDSMRHQFETQHWQPIRQEIEAFLHEHEQLAQALEDISIALSQICPD